MTEPHLTPQQLAERLHMTTGGLARWRCMGGPLIKSQPSINFLE